MSAFETGLDFTWRPENDGQPFHVTPGDPGGATAWGVTMPTFAAWRMMQGDPMPTVADLAAAHQTELATLLQVQWWNALQCDHLPAGVDLCVWDFAIGSGVSRSAKFLQMVLGFTGDDIDGRIGPVTLAAVSRHTPRDLVDALTMRDETFYSMLPGFRAFGHGWDRRADDRKALAYQLATEPKPVPSS